MRFRKNTHRRDIGRQLFESPDGFSGCGIAIRSNSAFLQICGVLSWRKQEVRKSQNHESRVDPAWSINSGKVESRPVDFPGFRRLRAAASSSDLKGSEIAYYFLQVFGPSVGWTAACWWAWWIRDSPVLCALFFASCEAIEFSETGHRREERPDLTVGLLMMLYASGSQPFQCLGPF